MTKEYFRYDKMVEAALRGVVREALGQAAKHGLVGDHHFYIGFSTSHPEVQIPDYLRAQYPQDMTIVLQYQFSDLEVKEDLFSVMLSFNNYHERLVIPFSAVTTFADPSVNFGLEFQLSNEEADHAGEERTDPADQTSEPAEDTRRGEVVALDAFRKK